MSGFVVIGVAAAIAGAIIGRWIVATGAIGVWVLYFAGLGHVGRSGVAAPG